MRAGLGPGGHPGEQAALRHAGGRAPHLGLQDPQQGGRAGRHQGEGGGGDRLDRQALPPGGMSQVSCQYSLCHSGQDRELVATGSGAGTVSLYQYKYPEKRTREQDGEKVTTDHCSVAILNCVGWSAGQAGAAAGPAGYLITYCLLRSA